MARHGTARRYRIGLGCLHRTPFFCLLFSYAYAIALAERFTFLRGGGFLSSYLDRARSAGRVVSEICRRQIHQV